MIIFNYQFSIINFISYLCTIIYCKAFNAMSPNELNDLLKQTVSRLSEPDSLHGLFHEHNDGDPLPSGPALAEILELCRAILFPGFYGKSTLNSRTLPYHIGVSLDRLTHLLTQQVLAGLKTLSNSPLKGEKQKASSLRGGLEGSGDLEESARNIVVEFIKRLPELRSILATDVEATYNGDPAAESYGEIISCYPVIKAITGYRIAHELLLLGVPLIPRIITEMAHSETGIDIHPGAQIGHHFTIDHGTGVVIGATCIIGNYVKLYQGVTLGAKSFTLDECGNPVKGIARHPILEDNVIVYSNATVLGRITLAKGTVIGGNLWVTESTQPGEQLVQAKKRKSQLVRPEDWGCL